MIFTKLFWSARNFELYSRHSAARPLSCQTWFSIILILTGGCTVERLIAQESDSSIHSPIPDITITAEDPLTLLPPLRPPASDALTTTVDPIYDRATVDDVPVLAQPTKNLSPLPQFAIDTARFTEAMERSANMLFTTRVNNIFSPSRVRVSGQIERQDQESEFNLGLNGFIPVVENEASQFSFRGSLSSDEQRFGLGLTVTSHDLQHSMNAYLHSFGMVETEFHYFSRGTTEAWNSAASLQMQLAINRNEERSLEALIGGSLQAIEGEANLLPSGQATYHFDKDRWLQFAIRSHHGYPLWLDNWLKESSELLPQNAWQVLVIGGFKDVNLTVGIAGGLMYKMESKGDTIAISTHNTKNVQLKITGSVHLGETNAGIIEMNTVSGLNWSWEEEFSGQVLLDLVWPVVERPPVSILFQGGMRWSPLYGIEDWHNSFDRFGSVLAAGVRWIVSHGNRFQLFSGVHVGLDWDLTQFVRIEYARNTVSLIALPEKTTQ